MEVPFLEPVATVLSHFNEEVPYKPSAYILNIENILGKSEKKVLFIEF